MVFSSIIFLFFFFPAILLGYYLLHGHRKLQNVFLCVGSLVFYTWGEYKFVFVMMLCILLNWWFALQMEKHSETTEIKRIYMVLAVSVDIGILLVYKYLTFLVVNLNTLAGLELPVPDIALPIGISFFTFQALSYTIDVYRGAVPAQPNVVYVALYISLFPQLIAGPIVRYETIAAEIVDRRETWDDFAYGWRRFIIGLGKKTLLADNLARLVDMQFNAVAGWETATVSGLWMGAIGYTLQIYYDFSGYSDMAIGLGRMFGFHFNENFLQPYQADSIQNFWRRWHISLSSWFRDYIYIPLGGNRGGVKRQLFNLLVVWLLTGLWHGANWTFIAWGLAYFCLLAIERFTPLKKTRIFSRIKRPYTLLLVTLLWVLFRSDTLALAVSYIGGMFGLSALPLCNAATVALGRYYGAFIVTGGLLCVKWPETLRVKLTQTTPGILLQTFLLLMVFVLSLASIANETYSPFIYFNF